MKFLKILVVLALLVGGGLWLYGSRMPREHSVKSAIVITANPDTVYKVIRNVAATPTWWTDLKSAKRVQGAGRETWEEDMGQGGVIQVEITRVVPGRRVVQTILDDGTQGWGGTWTIDVEGTPAGTTVTIIEEGYVDSPFFRIVMSAMGQHRTMESYLRSLAAHFGEMATPRRD